MRWRPIIPLSAILALPVAAYAQPVSGLYVAGAAGANFANTTRSESTNTKVATDPGPLGVVDLGWGFGNGFRVELEGAYRDNSVSELSVRRVNSQVLPTADVGGRIASYATMANALYDVDLRRFGTSLRPYIGVGVGIGWLQYDDVGGNVPTVFHLPENNTVDEDGRLTFAATGAAFAYQAIAGVAYPLRMVPGLAVTAEFRYFGIQNVRVDATTIGCCGNLVNGVLPTAHNFGRFGSTDELVLVGLRYVLGRPWVR